MKTHIADSFKYNARIIVTIADELQWNHTNMIMHKIKWIINVKGDSGGVLHVKIELQLQ